MQVTGCEDFQTVHQKLVMVLVMGSILVRERIRLCSVLKMQQICRLLMYVCRYEERLASMRNLQSEEQSRTRVLSVLRSVSGEGSSLANMQGLAG